jgi:hypothetical protein
MNNNFKICSTFKKNIDIYIFILCGNLKKNIEHITKLLDIDSIPKKLFNDYNSSHNFEKKFC